MIIIINNNDFITYLLFNFGNFRAIVIKFKEKKYIFYSNNFGILEILIEFDEKNFKYI